MATPTDFGLRGARGRFVSDPGGLAHPSQYTQGLQHSGVHFPTGAMGPYSTSVRIPTEKIAEALRNFALYLDRDAALAEALNHTRDKAHTTFKRLLQQWTGIKLVREVVKAMRKKNATPQDLNAAVIVLDYHRKISRDNFNAAWKGRYSPVTHDGWNKPRAVFGAFLLPGKQPAFRRYGTARNAIKPLYGPNQAREMERNDKRVRAELNALIQVDLVPRVVSNMRRAAEQGVRSVSKG